MEKKRVRSMAARPAAPGPRLVPSAQCSPRTCSTSTNVPRSTVGRLPLTGAEKARPAQPCETPSRSACGSSNDEEQGRPRGPPKAFREPPGRSSVEDGVAFRLATIGWARPARSPADGLRTATTGRAGPMIPKGPFRIVNRRPLARRGRGTRDENTRMPNFPHERACAPSAASPQTEFRDISPRLAPSGERSRRVRPGRAPLVASPVSLTLAVRHALVARCAIRDVSVGLDLRPT